MNIGIIGGGFNPITYGHLITIAEVLNSKKVDCVWVVPSPLRPDKNSLIDPIHRLAMCQLALEYFFNNSDNVLLKKDEIYNKKFLGTIQLLNKFSKKIAKQDKLFFVIGADNLKNISGWIDYTKLIKHYEFLVLKRMGNKIPKNLPYSLKNFTFIDNLSTNISSTDIRVRIKKNKSIFGLTPQPVIDYINQHRLYI